MLRSPLHTCVHPMKRAVFLDKDGTLIRDVAYNHEVERVQLLPGVRPAIQRLYEAGYVLVVISNQSGVAHGLFAETALEPMFRRLATLLDSGKPVISGFYYCPHHPMGSIPSYAIECGCRKPMPGLFM